MKCITLQCLWPSEVKHASHDLRGLGTSGITPLTRPMPLGEMVGWQVHTYIVARSKCPKAVLVNISFAFFLVHYWLYSKVWMKNICYMRIYTKNSSKEQYSKKWRWCSRSQCDEVVIMKCVWEREREKFHSTVSYASRGLVLACAKQPLGVTKFRTNLLP